MRCTRTRAESHVIRVDEAACIASAVNNAEVDCVTVVCRCTFHRINHCSPTTSSTTSSRAYKWLHTLGSFAGTCTLATRCGGTTYAPLQVNPRRHLAAHTATCACSPPRTSSCERCPPRSLDNCTISIPINYHDIFLLTCSIWLHEITSRFGV